MVQIQAMDRGQNDVNIIRFILDKTNKSLRLVINDTDFSKLRDKNVEIKRNRFFEPFPMTYKNVHFTMDGRYVSRMCFHCVMSLLTTTPAQNYHKECVFENVRKFLSLFKQEVIKVSP